MQSRGTLSKIFIWGIVFILVAAILLAVFSNSIEGIIQGDQPSASVFQLNIGSRDEYSQPLILALEDPDTSILSNIEFNLIITNTTEKQVVLKSVSAISRNGNSYTFFQNTSVNQLEADLLLESNESIILPVKFGFKKSIPSSFAIVAFGSHLVNGILPEESDSFYFENQVVGALDIHTAP